MKKIFSVLFSLSVLFCSAERHWKETLISGICETDNLVWNGSQFAMLGKNDSGKLVFLSSADGTSWSSNQIPVTLNPYGSSELVWLNQKYIIIANDTAGYYILTSVDGINWTSILTSFSVSQTILNIAWANNKYVAGKSNNAGFVYTSSDLINWAQHPLPSTTIQISSIHNVNGLLMSIGHDYSKSETYLLTSTDGITWQKKPDIGFLCSIYQFSYENREYIATGDNGALYSSKDATHWDNHSIFLGQTIRSIAWGKEDFLMIPTFTDGKMEVWSSRDLVWWRQYQYKPSIFFIDAMVAGSNHKRFLHSVAYDGSKFVVAGYDSYTTNTCNGVILTSP